MIELKEQTLTAILLLPNGEQCKCSITIKEGTTENRISIGATDIFFNKKGECSGDGHDLELWNKYN